MAVRPGYKQTEVGVIPEDWEVMPFIRAVGSYIDYRGRTPRKLGLSWGGGEILALSANNVQMGRIDPEKEAYFGSEELYREWMVQGECEPGDVLLTMEAPLGNVAQIPDSKKYILSQRVLLIKPKEWLYRNFLAHYMMGFVFQRQLSLNSTGSTAKGIQRRKLDDVPIGLPPTKAEQEAITEALSEADALIESLQQLLTKKRQLKRGAMQELLTGKKRLPGFSGEWEMKSVGELGDCFAGGTPSTFRREYWGGEICWLPSGRVQNCILDCPAENETRLTKRGLDESAAKRIKAHSVLVAITGATCANVACLEFEASANQSVVAIEPNSTVNYRYVYYSMLMERNTILSLQSGSAQGGVNLKAVKSIPLRLPSLPEQTAIAAILSDMDAEIAALETKLAKTRQLKQGMMQELLTGRIRLV